MIVGEGTRDEEEGAVLRESDVWEGPPSEERTHRFNITMRLCICIIAGKCTIR